jgi:hypothetical protein
MDTRTGYTYEGTPDEIARRIQETDAFKRSLDEIKGDLVQLANKPVEKCPKCHGTGAVPRGLNSKRFKPCPCCR